MSEVSSFTKDEITEIKAALAKFKSVPVQEAEIQDYMQSKLVSLTSFDIYSNYLEKIEDFIDLYLKSPVVLEKVELFFNLKSGILRELNQIIQMLQNLNSNCMNIKRLLKNGKNGNTYLEDLHSKTKDLLHHSNDIASFVINSLKEEKNLFSNGSYLWIELNKLKNLHFKLNKMPLDLDVWNELKELKTFIISLNEADKKRPKKEILTFHFDEIYQYYLAKDEKNISLFMDLIYLLYLNEIIEINKGEEFINILERKEVNENLKKFIQPLSKEFIFDKLRNILADFEDSNYVNSLKKQKINNILPNIVDTFIKGLERKFQEKIQDVIEAEKFEEIANYYYQQIDEFSGVFDEIEDWVLTLENYLSPYENITKPLKKIFSNLSSEIIRRKNEYLTFIKTVKDEELRVSIRKYVDEKISDVNDLIRNYEDKTSVIIKEEFPQLKKVKQILNESNSEIQRIKAEVFKKLESIRSNDVDIYQIIKLWEDNFNRKRQQLTFLISLLINKLFKSFKELIDKEGILFATITEISDQTDNFEGLPLNFALSSFLAEKLTEDELRERISEIESKINHLNNSLGLYQVELSKLETILANRVKLRKGISNSDVQCTVCHKYINFAKAKIITCPFCGSTYHYLCVAFWLSKYNSCPMCQNHFLEPHSGLFERQEDQELERY
ncbi:hypothetical protein LCGC14_0959850 [marine sediment metagenome]|uniref:RING-type domain-containing protein n=1 Tax=marine sediment metagenome TaxID=412755 RepID=A0A0F9RL86_9ZZZZ